MEYPYLGFKVFDEKDDTNSVVILFTSERHGVVVYNGTGMDEYRFGLNGEFDEDSFDFYPPQFIVRLNN